MMTHPSNPSGDGGEGGDPGTGGGRGLGLPPSPNIHFDNTLAPSFVDAPPSVVDKTPAATIASPFTMDDDDISDDVTVQNNGSSGPRPSTPPDQPTSREYTLKFLIQSPQDLFIREATGQFLQLLHAIVSIKATVPNVVFDMNDRPITKFSQDTAPHFLKSLPIDTSRGKPSNRKPNNYWIVFKINTQMTLSALRKHDLVANVLIGTKGRLSLHPWPVSDRDIVSIGFIVGAIPKYQMSEHFSTYVKSTISQKCNTKRVPQFRCVLSRISAPYKGVRIQCEAFDIQVRRQDVSTFVQLLYKAFPANGNHNIILYSDRYKYPDRFLSAVNLQAKFTDSHRIVAIKGIPEYDMFSFDRILHQEFNQILQVLPTHTTNRGNPANQPIGRWNLLCAKKDFDSLAKELYHRMPSLFSDYLCTEGKVFPEGAEPVEVVSYFSGKPSSANGSGTQTRDSGKESYNSAWTARLADYHLEAEVPDEVLRFCVPDTSPHLPAQPSAASGTWAQIASRKSNASSLYQHPPSVAPPPAVHPQAEQLLSLFQEQLDRMEARLEASIDAKIAALGQPRQPSHLPPNSLIPPPAPDPQNAQFDAVLSLLAERMNILGANLEAKIVAQLGSQGHQQTSEQQSLSPERKKSKPNISKELAPSSRPDGTSDQEVNLDETMQDVSS